MTTLLDEQLIECLRTATRVTALTGAGVSAESGVSTFRDAMSGLWSKFLPLLLGEGGSQRNWSHRTDCACSAFRTSVRS